MLEIFNFYIGIVVNLFENVLNGFQITTGLGFGTFLLGCGIFVSFVNVLKFRLSSNGISEIKSYARKNSSSSDKGARGVVNHFRK